MNWVTKTIGQTVLFFLVIGMIIGGIVIYFLSILGTAWGPPP